MSSDGAARAEVVEYLKDARIERWYMVVMGVMSPVGSGEDASIRTDAVALAAVRRKEDADTAAIQQRIAQMHDTLKNRGHKSWGDPSLAPVLVLITTRGEKECCRILHHLEVAEGLEFPDLNKDDSEPYLMFIPKFFSTWKQVGKAGW